MWSRNWVSFQSNWDHFRFLVGSCCLIFSFICNVLHTASDWHFGIFKLFLYYQYMLKKPYSEKGQTIQWSNEKGKKVRMLLKILHRKLKIETLILGWHQMYAVWQYIYSEHILVIQEKFEDTKVSIRSRYRNKHYITLTFGTLVVLKVH
jgi:hypothetical protein